MQLAHTYFMPLALSAIAVVARVRALLHQLTLDAVRAYNDLGALAVRRCRLNTSG